MSLENNNDSECHRFFAFSKRVPKDVKRYCGICRQHGVLCETRGHTCEFKNCTCNKCELVRTRRQVMSQQIRLRRAQDKRFQRTAEPTEADVIPIKETAASKQSQDSTDAQELLMDAKNMCYFCQKCKDHGILVWKKLHKRQCPYVECPCELCDLIETRRRLDQHIKRKKQSEASNGSSSSTPDSFSQRQQSTPVTPQNDRQSVSSSYSGNCENDSIRTSPMEFSQPPPCIPVSSQPTAEPVERIRTVYVHVPVPVPADQMPHYQNSHVVYSTPATQYNTPYLPPNSSTVSCNQVQQHTFPSTNASFYPTSSVQTQYSAFQPVQQQPQQFQSAQSCQTMPQMSQPAQPAPFSTTATANEATFSQLASMAPSASTVASNGASFSQLSNVAPPTPGSSILMDPLLEQLLRSPCPDLAKGDESQISYAELERTLASKHQQRAVACNGGVQQQIGEGMDQTNGSQQYPFHHSNFILG